MERKEFLKRACSAGFCACAVASLLAPSAEAAEGAPPEDWRLSFMRERYAKLLEALAARVDAKTFDAILEDVGRFCAGTASFVKEHAGDPDGFIAAIKDRWHAEAAFDRASGVVTLAFPPAGGCPCPLVVKGVTPASVCRCSLGWQRHAFETVTGRPVQAELKSSVLRGDARCSFEMRVGASASAS